VMRQVLAFVIVAALLSRASASGVPAGAQAVPGPDGWELPLLSFGAKCDGQTNDAAAIQRAFDAARRISGTVVWPAKTCTIATGVTLGGERERSSFVGIRGATPNDSALKWTGPQNGVALTISHNKYFKIEGLSVLNGGARGTTQGVQLTGPLTVGTQTLAGQFERFSVSGFNVGIQAGVAGGKATSEIQWTFLSLNNNDVGLRTGDMNTLDHQLHMLLCGNNGICVQHHTGELWVDGGSASYDTRADFDFSTNSFGIATIRNFRTESANRFITGAVPNLTVESVSVNPSSNPDRVVIELAAGQGNYLTSIRQSELWGYVKIAAVSGATGMVVMENNRVQSDTDLPLTYDPAGAVEGNRIGNLSGRFVNNIRAVYGQGNRESRFDDYPFFNIQHGSPDPLLTVRRANDVDRRNDDRRPVDLLQFNRVKMLAEGGYADGRNLRFLFQFPGTAATVNVPFTRPETVGVTAWRHERLANDRFGYDTITVGANRFTQGDVGKRVVVKGACGGGTDCVGVIKSITDATHVVMQFKSGGVNGNGFAITNTAAEATIGENEPDALYLPAVSCNAQETISWSNLSATGLTLTSSNPKSTATCVVLLVR
jgi:hypothetical protein